MTDFLDKIRIRLSGRKIKIIEIILFVMISLLLVILLKIIWNI
ncbi:MAG: hypothetical protein NTV31_10030 [Bacteroidia bacterium]|nr:hypothetical protein [Bacteroidia bacterium]